MEGRLRTTRRRPQPRYWLAILRDPQDPEPPSDDKALRKFVKAAENLGLGTELIDRNDYGRLGEFDSLFIRDTTRVNHYTYRFSRRATSEGLVVIDDPQSIVRCTNKVYLAELLSRHKILTPRTMVVHRRNLSEIEQTLGFPVVLKLPDSSFSAGVVKVDNQDELAARLEQFFAESDLIVAQEFVPTTFDWRIGILDRHPLYAAKYFMAPKHWQIIRQDRPQGHGRYGKMETLPVELAPTAAVRLALKAANLIGDGLYGVDVKQSNGSFYIIEVNDNPTLEAGCEDSILKDELYRRIMEVFLRRMEKAKGFGHRP
jgi:glutathione synthase/RimK-type ligase-like ATP-grasp enzyme